jgi:DNA mismatch repair ATPase MutL
MNRRVLHRVILSFVCALSLALIPMPYSWAQSTGSQQDQTQTDRNADQQNQDVNQDTNQRQKPASEPNNMQNQSQTTEKSQTQEKTTTTTEKQTGKSREGLPASAGELPLLALIGVLSLAAAGSTWLFARAKSTR